MRKLKLLGLLCAFLCACGCRAAWVPRSGQPGWVDRPAATEEEGRFLSAIGMAEPGADPELVKAQADLAARDALRNAIADHTRSAVAGFLAANRQYPPVTSPLCQELIEILRTEVAAGILRLAAREEAWQAPDGHVYVLYRVPLAVVHAELSVRTRYALAYVNPFGAEADQAAAALDAHVEALLNERLKAAARERPRSKEVPPEQRTPAWLEIGRHEAYPADRFHSAIGLGRDLPGAEASARSELASRLNAQMARLAVRIPGDASAGPLAANLQWFKPGVLKFVDADMTMARIAERWHDPITSTHYTLVVLDPATAILLLRRRITETRDQAAGLLTLAGNHQRAENYAASVREYREAVVAAAAAASLQVKAVAIAPQALDEMVALLPEPLLDQACQGVKALLSRLKLEKVMGDLQWVQPGSAPREAFTVKAGVGEPAAPAADLPLRFVLQETGEVLGRANTDKAGLARWRMAPAPPGRRSGAIIARVDLEAADLPIQAARLSIPEVKFDYVLRSKANSYLVLYVQERTEEGRTLATPVAGALEQAMTEQGFQLVPRNDVLKHVKAADLAPDSPDKAVLDTFASLSQALGPGSGLLIVAGEFQPHVAETTRVDDGDLYFARCPYQLRVLDPALPAAQQTVLSISGAGSAAYLNDRGEALQRAREEALRQATAALLTGLLAKLGP